MIIQCRQCRTKYNFDDALMQGTGVWLRCSHCQHVYFQDNPLIMKPETGSPSGHDPAFSEEVMPAEKSAELSKESPSVFYRDEEGMRFLDEIIEENKHVNDEINMEIEKNQRESISEEQEELEQNEVSSPKSSGKIWKIAVWSILVIAVIPLVIYFFVFPELGNQIIKNVLVYVGISEPVPPAIVISQVVKLQDVRHRLINNYILGQIGVVEGTAVNRADYPISRILIKGEILDAYSVVLGEHTSYAGNILTDEELTNLSEEEIFKNLSLEEGRNNSNDKIMPNGQIPFMIVFSREPAGVIKTTVVTVGVERLL